MAKPTDVDTALIDRINENHRKLHGIVREATRGAFSLAFEIGEDLQKQHTDTERGHWEALCDEFLIFNRREADNYRRVWRERDKILAAIAALEIGPSLRQAVKYLAEKKDEEESSATVKPGLDGLAPHEIVSQALVPVLEELDGARRTLLEHLGDTRAETFLVRAVDEVRAFLASWATAQEAEENPDHAIGGYAGDQVLVIEN